LIRLYWTIISVSSFTY